MKRIKNLDEIIVGETEVLLEWIRPERKSGLKIQEKLSDSGTNHYGVILAVGANVKDLEKGDIVVRTRIDEVPAYNVGDKVLLMLPRYHVVIAVKPANFNATDEITA